MPSDLASPEPECSDANFTSEELALMAGVRKRLEAHIADYDAPSKHRAFLAVASELVDAAADVSAEARPGVRAVELGILAERISQLACDFHQSNDDEN